MENQSAKTKKEILLMDLSKVPVATSQQLSKRYSNNLSPLKKVSQHLVELEKEKMVKWFWHYRQKVWSLTPKARKILNISPMKYNRLNHALAISDIYFTLFPSIWIYEPLEKFKYEGKGYKWPPDFIMGHKGKLYAAEIQLSPLSKTRWEKKWLSWNLYFKEAYKTAQYQSLVSKPPTMPRMLCITKQSGAAEGFNIPQRTLQIISDISQLG